MHPDLVVLVRAWIVGLEPDESLFPKLARRKTYTMVQKDLERAGIPYETHEGLADFHAAGRHSHITVSGRAKPATEGRVENQPS